MVRLKAGYGTLNWDANRKFQFLMVRLKGNSTFQKTTKSTISIPYGAIKSYNGLLHNNMTKIFQFLMVRLKGKQRHVHH